ncbi:hypothetical protein ACF0H5_023224 [Mactra antiquata]
MFGCGCNRNYNIGNCKRQHVECGGNPDGIRCTECYDSYYPGGYNNGCHGMVI